MNIQIKSLRTFIGSKDFGVSRSFYSDLGFKELVIDPKLSLFQKDGYGFYLQDYYFKEWLENTMLFLEVENPDEIFTDLTGRAIDVKYKDVKISPVKKEVWSEVCFVHDPSGVLLHFAKLY